ISGNTLTASATGATYQWINCNGNIDIAGQTGKSFTPEESGSYAVRVTVNGCTSTSSCVDVVIVGLQEHLSELISLYPNPANSRVTIELPVPSTNITIDITDASGRSSIRKFYDYGKVIELDTRELSPGMYILHLKASQMAKTIKLVIK
ncbi:MAG: T9SS type A sorting domain-containing protein, partial [Cyclobacteriaceae bacterium]|nr:T9SS type A sorting domain-containing protein [Cyclobacteriaceae bacterium]